MQDKSKKILDELKLPHGIEIDEDEAWRKTISRQFGGDAGRGFAELIQNALDSFPSSVPWLERRIIIEHRDSKVMILDYGEGMHKERLRLIATMGGTDKKDDKTKIGQFGVGFCSIFNPKLGTKWVKVTTKCEGHVVEMVFKVIEPEKRPKLSISILENEIDFSTKVEVKFNNEISPKRCIDAAHKRLRYYPCNVTINNYPFESIWEEAGKSGYHIFNESACDGFISPEGWGNMVTLLCKYEYILSVDLAGLITGNHGRQYNLLDYARKEFPYVRDMNVTVNCNSLNVTISRDAFYLDSPYHNMIKELSRQALLYLGAGFNRLDKDLILANHFTLRKRIRIWLDQYSKGETAERSKEDEVIERLATAKVYKINGRKNQLSLKDLLDMKSNDLPLYYSPDQLNLRWLGGAFKHDFIVLPDTCETNGGAPDFYDSIFKDIFGDVVNLDTIRANTPKLKNLVERGIVEESALSPTCSFVAERRLREDETEMLSQLDSVLSNPAVTDAIWNRLKFRPQKIRTAFFDVDGSNATIATGLFDKGYKALTEARLTNLQVVEEEGSDPGPPRPDTVILGLRRDHPFLDRLIKSNNQYRVYYALVFLAHELALCQKALVPYSPFYHWVKERLASDMRTGLMSHLLNSGGERQKDA